MADETKILAGSYRGIPIRIEAGSVTGGRKKVIKRFPGRDTNSVEDLGGMPRSYQLRIIVSDIQGQDYFAYRDSLLAVLELSGTGVLQHPMYGRIDNVVAIPPYSLSENFSEFGRSILSVNFEISENTGIPQQVNTALSEISKAGDAVSVQVVEAIADNFAVSNRFKDNFAAAVDKVNEIIAAAKDATSFIGDATTNINEINATISALEVNVNSLVTQPQQLADAIGNLFANINGFAGTVENTAETFAKLFGFDAEDDEPEQILTEGGISYTDGSAGIKPTTASLVERAVNDTLLSGSVNALALSYSYTNIAQSTFETVDQIDEAANALEAQYQVVSTSVSTREVINNGSSTIFDASPVIVNSGIPQSVKDAITDQRTVTQQFFDQQRITARQVLSVFTPETSARLLSYQYYGDSGTADNIIQLNELTDISFINGDLDILSA